MNSVTLCDIGHDVNVDKMPTQYRFGHLRNWNYVGVGELWSSQIDKTA